MGSLVCSITGLFEHFNRQERGDEKMTGDQTLKKKFKTA